MPKKYEGLGGTELAISESQERMAVVVAPEDAEQFLSLAEKENLEATVVARVTETPRLVMHFGGKTIVDVSREFLNSNGAEKHITVHAEAPRPFEKKIPASFRAGMEALAGDLNVCSRRGLAERFDSTIGAGAVLMPFGGRRQLTPVQAMVQKISLEKGDTGLCSLMAWGYNPFIAEKSPFHTGPIWRWWNPSPGWWPPARSLKTCTSPSRNISKSPAEPQALGQAPVRAAGRVSGPAGIGRGGHRRQGFHERLL